MVTVICSVPIYEHEESSITVKSHWNSSQKEWIEIELGDHVFSVSAYDLLTAVEVIRNLSKEG